ncbi:hypothetical protein [Amycolatopsis lexingtonensis]|uniref:hypothetical protein n=1 Tax=Amycolatopsis lexingtonensis TaxID=218822 RepID=UPI003F70AEC8
MTEQLEIGFAARHAGQAANLAAGAKPYRDDRGRVEYAVRTLANSRAAFTADDVHRLVQYDGSNAPYDRNLVSSVLGTWAQARRILREDTRVSQSPSRHASRNGVWRAAPRDTPPPPLPRQGA